MKWSFKIGRLLGIELRIHVTFFLIVAYAAYAFAQVNPGDETRGAFYGAAVISVLFLCVVIHEMAHSKMAQHYGAEVESITLLPIGGVSQLKKMPSDPGKELWVSIVGPLSNLVIAAGLFLALAVMPNRKGFATSDEFFDLVMGISVEGFVTYLLLINIMLAVFNLLPAFPLDGGRVLRSLLAMFMPSVKATRIARVLGQGFAVILGVTGLVTGNIWWILIAFFIYFGASQEGTGAEIKDILSSLKVRQALTGQHDTVTPDALLRDVVALALHSYQEDFPVLDADGRLVGLLTRSSLLAGLHNQGPDVAVDSVMEKEFPTVGPDTDFAQVFEKMNEMRTRAIPVVDNGYLLGMVTLEHLSEAFRLLSATREMILPP